MSALECEVHRKVHYVGSLGKLKLHHRFSFMVWERHELYSDMIIWVSERLSGDLSSYLHRGLLTIDTRV